MMKTLPAARLLVSASLLLMACSTPPEWSGKVEEVNGIEIVSNPGEPLLPEAGLRVSELWTVQGGDWVDPTLVHAHSGSITVVDPRANQLHHLSLSGDELGSLGRPGGGPGEFLNLLDVFPVGERLAVLDAGKGSVQFLDGEGRYLSSLHLQGQPWAGFSLEGNRLLVKGEFLSDPREESFGDWVTVGEGGEPTEFTSAAMDPLPEEEGVRCYDLSSWDGGAARLRFTTPQIQIFDPSGALLKESRVDLPVELVSQAERDAALDELRRSLTARGLPPPFVEQNLVVSEERWKVKCRFGPMRFDGARGYGAFMEQNPRRFGSGTATLHFLSRDGVYLARVPFSTEWRDFAMDDGVVYALALEPATDLVSLTAFQVDLPSSLFSDVSEALESARRQLAEGR
jgi:hypothetical protein